MVQAIAEGSLERPSSRRHLLILSCLIGTSCEAFDYFLYAFLTTSLAFNHLFFPGLDPAVGTIAAFGVFAVGLMARPLGGLFFGHFGDRIGRKPTMIYTLGLMGLSTAAIGLVPTYEAIGIAAPIALTLLRFLQGFAYGGENSAAPVLVLESVPRRQSGFYTALILSGILVGSLAAAFTADLIGHLPTEDLLAWGWRVPFVASILVVSLGLYIRVRIEESPVFVARLRAARPAVVPLAEVLRDHKRTTLIAIVIATGQATVTYFPSVYGLSYATDYLHLPRTALLDGITLGNALGVFLLPFCGMLGDRFGRRPVMIFAYVSSILFFAIAFFPLLRTGDAAAIAVAMAVPCGILQPLTLGIGASFFGELFPDARIRFTGVSLGKQAGSMLGGGVVPVVAASIAAASGGQGGLLALVVAICGAALVAVALAPETRDRGI